MLLPDRMFLADWIRDPRLRRLPAHLQLLLHFLRHVCDRNGRFEFDAKPLHRALYESAQCGNVSIRDVAAWLETLRLGDFIKSYTAADGRRVGEIAPGYWRQRLNYGKDVFDPPDPGQPTLPLGESPAPPVVRKKPKAPRVCESPPSTHFTSFHISEGMQGEGAPRATAMPGKPGNGDEWRASSRDLSRPSSSAERDLRPAASCLEELVARYPRHDVRAQLRLARAYVRKQRADAEAEVSVDFFTRQWMPKAAERPPAPPAPVAPPAPAIDPAILEAQHAADRARLAALPEPEKGTLEHALWTEARKPAA